MKVRIDKSLFDATELEQYYALIAKASVAVDDEEDEDAPDFEFETPEQTEEQGEEEEKEEAEKEEKKFEKSAISPEIIAMREELAELRKSYEMKEYAEIAKKYAPLGKDEAELATKLYDMKKSNEANYNAYIEVLDEHLEMVNKSGLFQEIGKSAGGYNNTGKTQDKIWAKAEAYMKSGAAKDYTAAVAKAWQESPELMEEYDAEYFQ